MDALDDRRNHPRYPLRAFAALGSSEQEWAAHVLDISFVGARVALLDEHHLPANSSIKLRLEIPETIAPKNKQAYIHLHGELVHKQGHMLGIQYQPDTEMDAQLLTQLLQDLGK